MSNREPLEIKVILLGECGVGKTSIINRFINDKFDSIYETTSSMSYSFKIVERNKQKYKLNLWDTIGQEKFRSLSRMFLNEAKIVILVYSITSKETFDNLKYWLELYNDNKEENSVLGVAANKVDLFQDEEVSDKLGKEFAKDNGAIFSLISAKDNKEGIDLFLDDLLDAYLNGNNLENNIENKNKNIKLTTNKPKNEKKRCCVGKKQNDNQRKRLKTMSQNSHGFVNSIFLGENGVGKTSIIKRIKGDEFKKDEKHTEMISDCMVDYNDDKMKMKMKMKLKIFDINNEKQNSKDFIKTLISCNIFFLVYDIKKQQTLDNLENWIETIKKYKEDEKKDDNYLIYLIGNKNDLSFDEDEDIKGGENEEGIIISDDKKNEKYIEEGRELSKKYNAFFNITSAYENIGIENIVGQALQQYINLP